MWWRTLPTLLMLLFISGASKVVENTTERVVVTVGRGTTVLITGRATVVIQHCWHAQDTQTHNITLPATPASQQTQILTRHKASTSMYSLTCRVRVMSPEHHQWKPTVQASAVMLRMTPSMARRRPASHAHLPYTARNFENAPRHLERTQTPPRRLFTLCHHIAGWMQAYN